MAAHKAKKAAADFSVAAFFCLTNDVVLWFVVFVSVQGVGCFRFTVADGFCIESNDTRRNPSMRESQ